MEDEAKDRAKELARQQKEAEREAKREAERLEDEAKERAKQAERQAREDRRAAEREADRLEDEAKERAKEAERRERDARRAAEREADRLEDLAKQQARDAERRAKEAAKNRDNGAPDPSLPKPPSRSVIAGPSSGGGHLPSSGTQRNSQGAAGWTLAPGPGSNSPGEGYDGLVLDIRCREAGKSHLECPEYIKKFTGRDAAGFERFGQQHATPASSNPNTSTRSIPRQISPQIGDNGVNGGGPSTTVLDDAGFDRLNPNAPLSDGTQGGRVRDLLSAPDEDDPWNTQIIIPSDP